VIWDLSYEAEQMTGLKKLASLVAPFVLGCTAQPPPNTGAGRDVVTTLAAVPTCDSGTGPSLLLAIDHVEPLPFGDPSTPRVPADGSLPDFANALVVDDNGIYFDAGYILRAPPGGGGATRLMASPAFVSSFAVVDSFLWASAQWGVPGLLRLPLDGPAPSFGPAIEGILDVAGASGRVFYTSSGGKVVASYGNDLAPGPTIDLTNVARRPLAIAGADVFVVTSDLGSSSTTIERGSADGGAATVIATSAVDIPSIAASSTFVYWVEAGVGGAPRVVRRAAHDGSNAEVVANLNVSALAVDEGAAYFAVDDGTIVKTAADTLASTVLAQGQVRPSAITQHGPRVYWINDREESSSSTPTANAVMTACK
jgi:hypothetical protein